MGLGVWGFRGLGFLVDLGAAWLMLQRCAEASQRSRDEFADTAAQLHI